MDYARDHASRSDDGCPLWTAVGLEAACGVSNSTISRWLKREVAAKLDDLERAAAAYGLHAWQMLYPQLDPANPPMVPYSPAELELYEVLKAGVEVITRSNRELPENEVAREARLLRDDRPGREVSSKGSHHVTRTKRTK